MKVNVWGINYAPELTGIGVYSTQMCEFLAQRSDSVDMVTGFAYYPEWKRRADDPGGLYRTNRINGVNVHRCWLYVPTRASVAKRILHELSFVCTSFVRQLFLPKPDIYIVVSPPLLLGFAAWIISRLKGAPYIFHVQDMQPDAAAQLSMLKEGTFLKILRWLEKFSYEKALVVSGISIEMQNAFIRKGVPAEKTYIFPNSVSLDFPAASHSWKHKYGFNGTTSVVSYAGNMGNKQGLELIVESAKATSDTSVLYVMAGDGAERPTLQKMVDESKIDNVKFEGVLPEDEHTALLTDSTICLIVQKPGTGASFLPSKLLKILALGRPVITNADDGSALYQAVKEGGFGLIVNSNDPHEFSQAIVTLTKDAELRNQMSERGKKYVKQFDSKNVLTNFRNMLETHVQTRGSSSHS